jgi:hypothetical protein
MDTRLIIRDTIVEKIKEIDSLLGGWLFIETHSFLDWSTWVYFSELGMCGPCTKDVLVLVKIYLINNLSLTICVQDEEIILIGYGHLFPLGSPSFVPYNDDTKRIFENVNRIRQRISLHQLDCVEQTIKILAEVASGFYVVLQAD